ncbi:MAG: DUF4115 domain-containing protein, partial [Acidobacteriota bacterium]|nr:DUF4115 domain-containing protein [Acidobacteriota bacterium]
MGSLGVGATLREERLRRHLSIEEIARQTKIPERSLKAIESDEFDSLPGIVFTRNFVRQYASILDIDPTPLLQILPRFDLATAPMPNPPVRPRRSGWNPRWNSSLPTVLWTVLAVGAAGAAYLHFNKLPLPLLVQAKSPEPRAEAKTSPPQASPSSAAASEATPPVAAPVPEPSAAQPAAASGTHAVNVVVKATADAWIQLTADGKNAFTGILKAGESK